MVSEGQDLIQDGDQLGGSTSTSSGVCDCRNQINDRLQERNGRLAFGFHFGDGKMTLSAPIIEVEKINPRGKKPPIVLATFCPFCGSKCAP